MLLLWLAVAVAGRLTSAQTQVLSFADAAGASCLTSDGRLGNCVSAGSCHTGGATVTGCPRSHVCCLRAGSSGPRTSASSSLSEPPVPPRRVRRQVSLCTYVRPVQSVALFARSGRRRRQLNPAAFRRRPGFSGRRPQWGQLGRGPQRGQLGRGPQRGQSGRGPQRGQFGRGPQRGQLGLGPQRRQLGRGPQRGQLGLGPQRGQLGRGPQQGQLGLGPQRGQFGRGPQRGPVQLGQSGPSSRRSGSAGRFRPGLGRRHPTSVTNETVIAGEVLYVSGSAVTGDDGQGVGVIRPEERTPSRPSYDQVFSRLQRPIVFNNVIPAARQPTFQTYVDFCR